MVFQTHYILGVISFLPAAEGLGADIKVHYTITLQLYPLDCTPMIGQVGLGESGQVPGYLTE